jgi:hypothetical protein
VWGKSFARRDKLAVHSRKIHPEEVDAVEVDASTRVSSWPWKSVCKCILSCFSSYLIVFCLKRHKRVHSG